MTFSTTGATRYIGNDTSRVYAYPSPAPAGSYAPYAVQVTEVPA